MLITGGMMLNALAEGKLDEPIKPPTLQDKLQAEVDLYKEGLISNLELANRLYSVQADEHARLGLQVGDKQDMEGMAPFLQFDAEVLPALAKLLATLNLSLK